MLSAENSARTQAVPNDTDAYFYARFDLAGQNQVACYVSQGINRLGYRAEDFTDALKTWQDIVHYEDLPEVISQIHGALQTGSAGFRLSYRLTDSDGGLHKVMDFRTVNYGADGRPASMDCVVFIGFRHGLHPGAEAERLERYRFVERLLITCLNAPEDGAFNLYLRTCAERLGADRIAYLNLNRQKELAEMTACYAAPGYLPRNALVVLMRSFSPELRQSLNAEGVITMQEDELRRFMNGIFYDTGIRSAAIAAVRTRGTITGFLLFEIMRRPCAWEDDTVAMLRHVAEAAGVVLRYESETLVAKNSLRASQTVLDNMPAYIYVMEPETNELIYANNRFMREFGADAIGKPCWLAVWGYMSPACLSCINTDCQGAPQSREVYLDHRNQWLRASISTVEWFDGRPARIATCIDITREKIRDEEVKKINFTDSLTGLPNRNQCDKDVGEAIELARQGGRMGYVAFVDMDDFKVINEGYGFDCGDAVLKEFAGFLTDNFSPKHRIYRTGGDEFAILLDSSNSDDVQTIAQLLLDRSRRPWKAMGKLVYVTVSLGLVQYPEELTSARDIIRNADLALYQAKRAGKNSFAFFTRNEGQGAVARVEMERLLRDAIADHFAGFIPYFQPIVNLQQQRISGAEALLRWRDETGKMVMPGDFIPLAEYLGLIIPIGEFVMEESARVCRYINENYRSDFTMNINVSMRQLMLDDFVERTDRILSRTGVDYGNVILEITEGIAVEDVDRLVHLCDALRERGIRFAMDDFGTGYSSLNNLRIIPLDCIKIDKSFIREVAQGSYANSFIHLITDLGHSMNRTICMEGVETEDQLGYCIMTGVDYVQGYYYSPPVPQERFMEILCKPLEKLS